MSNLSNKTHAGSVASVATPWWIELFNVIIQNYIYIYIMVGVVDEGIHVAGT